MLNGTWGFNSSSLGAAYVQIFLSMIEWYLFALTIWLSVSVFSSITKRGKEQAVKQPIGEVEMAHRSFRTKS